MNATKTVKYEEEAKKKKPQNQSNHGKKQRRYNCTKPTWDPDIDWVLWFWLWMSMNPLWNLKIWSSCCIFGWRQVLTWQLLKRNTDWWTGFSIWRSRCFLEIYNIDHIELKKNLIQCHMKVRWRERAQEGQTAWIPLVNPTYQVISVLLHWFTAGKSHKTRGGWIQGQKQQRLLFLRLTEVNRSQCIATVTTIKLHQLELQLKCEQLWPSTELLMPQARLYKRGTFTKGKPNNKL